MYFALSFISVLFVLTTTFVQSAPTTPLDAATLLNNAQQAQQLNAQFQSANSSATGPCNNGDTTCVKDAIATCVNGQFDTSKGRCRPSLHCFALPSVRSNGTTIGCFNEKTVQSLIDAAGATGGITGSGSGGGPASSINSASPSSTLSGAIPAAAPTEAATSMGPDCYSTITTTFTPTATTSQSLVTVTITLLPSVPTTLPPVTQTLSPDQASSLLASLLAQGGQVATDGLSGPSETSVSVSVTDIPSSASPTNTSETSASASVTDIPSPASPSTNTPVAIANNASSSASSGSGYGGYSGY